jgi:hypothetical protein
MIWVRNKVNKSYNWELVLFNKVRKFDDGITFFNINIDWDRYLEDHSPSFLFELTILNINIIEFNIFYKYHRDLTT